MPPRRASGYLTAADGCRLFWRGWFPVPPVRGQAVLVHGANEHSGRYEHVAAWLVGLGFEVRALDLRGHGRSAGLRGHVDRFEQYLEDLERLVESRESKAGGAGGPGGGPGILLIGHSMGGLIAFAYAAWRPERVGALVVSAPWFGLRMRLSALDRLLAPVGARLVPRLRRPAGIEPGHLSRDPRVARAYRDDPLVGTTVTARWFVECSRTAARARTQLAGQMRIPVLFLQGDADRIVDPGTTRAVFEAVPHPCKALRRYPEGYHELFNDLDQGRVLADVEAWLEGLGLWPAAAQPRDAPSTGAGLTGATPASAPPA